MRQILLQVKSVSFAIIVVLTINMLLPHQVIAYEKEIKTIAETMAENIAKSGKTRVAVVDFTDLQGDVTELGRFIAEEFAVALLNAGQGFEIVDRTHLKTLLKEYKLSTTGLIDPSTARKLGEIAGVDALVTGTITPFGENVRLSVKILDVSTAKLIGANVGNIPKTQAIMELLGREIGSSQQINTPTGQEIQEKSGISGEFFDDFSTGPHPNWNSASGNWTMANGMYTVTDITDNGSYFTFFEKGSWTNFQLTIDIQPGSVSSGRYDRIAAWVCPRMLNIDNGVCFELQEKYGAVEHAAWRIKKDGKWSDVQSRVELETPNGQIIHIKIEIKNNVFTAYLNGSQLNQVYDRTFSSGSIGLGQWYQYWDHPYVRFAFDNIKITPLN